MAQQNTNERRAASRRVWSDNDVNALKTLVKQNTPTRVIGLKLGRTESSVRSKAQSEGISLEPVNQSPYG